ncbi:uncharacterized protein LOC120740213 [Simochromis diagramma]|uniref:uncharacterized protein LOC120740213 n=1 Tax=Simochromis diagramma TaxID=43689 RepID=UPI001A7F001E|nr:uncharacterized protein LOC120740213 [Simochromis diagramma]
MEKSGKEPKLENSFQLMNAGVRENEIDRPRCCMNADYFYRSPNRCREMNQEFCEQKLHFMQHVEMIQPRVPDDGRETSSRMNLHHQSSDDCFSQGAMPNGTKRECGCWECGAKRCGTTEPANGNTARGEDECDAQPQSDLEEELEAPLPLKDDNEWQHCTPFLLPHHDVHSCGEWLCNLNRYHPQSRHLSAPFQHWTPWNQPQNGLQFHDHFKNNIMGSVSVNVPQFSLPTVEDVSRVSMLNVGSAGGEESASHPHGKRKSIRLPDECRNVFITYSSDVSSEMVPFVDFLTKQGFRPAIDLYDSSIRCMDVNKWTDSYLKDPLTLIIIAISPKYKEDIEGPAVDSHGLHTRYIHSIMQNEFIQQGSLNFRFIPVLFLCAAQKHVPSWLQNTRVYRWPQDTEDLLLRLLREERYVAPPVPVELSLFIRPVTMGDAATL